MSDDGEPSGTAGRPMLTALLHSGVGEIVAVCTRWYGGTKLGTGGLQRAYASGVRTALEGLATRTRIARRRIDLVFAYPHVDAVRRLLDDAEAHLVDESYDTAVRYRVSVPEIDLERLVAALSDLTSGAAEVAPVD
jgi:putative IMPACT (imprinted ancient) family translation regulator